MMPGSSPGKMTTPPASVMPTKAGIPLSSNCQQGKTQRAASLHRGDGEEQAEPFPTLGMIKPRAR